MIDIKSVIVRFALTVLLVLHMQMVSADENYARAMAAWQMVLSDYVDAEGRTDFRRLATEPENLEQVVEVISKFGPNTAPEYFDSREKILTYHINAYNALAMQGVINEGIPKAFNSFFKRAGFFRFRKVVVDGDETNLYDYENKVIRKFGEPRIHFALNCMVKDCPRLPQEPFDAEKLEEQLEQATIEFFGKDKHFYRKADRQEIWVSEILDFYTKDFAPSGKAQDLIPYINRYVADSIPTDWRVKFIDYDWSINQQP